jgi:glutamyl-Q tRNA(Asp) synthetase
MNAATPPQPPARYRGRFAPSPSGPLHFGSLIAAAGSYLDARAHEGQWQVRIEDIDTPRVIPGAADDILRTLERLGLHWDGMVEVQSRRHQAYHAALEQLRRHGVLYPCACTRREIADSALHGVDGFVYPGTCRAGLPADRAPRAVRVRTAAAHLSFDDAVFGAITQNLDRDVGDFVVWRADGLFAYQLAVVVDDAEQGITDIVRGADLLDSTPRQIYLQQLLGAPTPNYAHLPVAVNGLGEKLSKQTRARAIDIRDPAREIINALKFLGQALPDELQSAAVAHESEIEAVWRWACSHWDRRRIPARRTITVSDAAE